MHHAEPWGCAISRSSWCRSPLWKWTVNRAYPHAPILDEREGRRCDSAHMTSSELLRVFYDVISAGVARLSGSLPDVNNSKWIYSKRWRTVFEFVEKPWQMRGRVGGSEKWQTLPFLGFGVYRMTFGNCTRHDAIRSNCRLPIQPRVRVESFWRKICWSYPSVPTCTQDPVRRKERKTWRKWELVVRKQIRSRNILAWICCPAFCSAQLASNSFVRLLVIFQMLKRYGFKLHRETIMCSILLLYKCIDNYILPPYSVSR